MDYYSEKLDELLLQEAYEHTLYQIVNPSIPIQCGAFNPFLDDYMYLLGHRSFTFLTAANPRSVLQSENQNSWANANLEIDLANTGLNYTYSFGKDKSGNWPLEESFVVFDIGLDVAMALAEKYNQNAILIGRIAGKAKLQWT